MRDLLAEFIAECAAESVGAPADPLPCAECGGTDHQTLLHGIPETAVSGREDER